MKKISLAWINVFLTTMNTPNPEPTLINFQASLSVASRLEWNRMLAS